MNESSSQNNFGSKNTLRVDNSPVSRSYFRFKVSGLNSAAVQSARLRVYANCANKTGYTLSSVGDKNWVEDKITYANAPTLGDTINNSAPFEKNRWTEVDLGTAISVDGVYSLVITTTSRTSTNHASRESSNPPQLVVTLAETPTALPTETLASTAAPTLAPTLKPQATSTPLAPTSTPAAPTPTAGWQPTTAVAATANATANATASAIASAAATVTATATPTQSSLIAGNTLLLAGDICKHNLNSTDYTANCKKTGDLVRSLLASNPGATVQALGNNVNNGSGVAFDSQYTDLYTPNWGSFLNVTRSVMGNHDTYPPSGTTPYFNFFGIQAGTATGGFYSDNIGNSWHVIALNAQYNPAGGCAAGSPQYNSWKPTPASALWPSGTNRVSPAAGMPMTPPRPMGGICSTSTRSTSSPMVTTTIMNALI